MVSCFSTRRPGVANFAQGTLATLGAFFAYRIGLGFGLNVWVCALLAVVLMSMVGILIYVLALRPRDDAGRLNLTMRTLGVQMLILALIERYWSTGQPFPFTSMFPPGVAISVAQIAISWATLGVVLVALLLAGAFVYMFRSTDLGLLFVAVSERPEVVRLLGGRSRRLTMMAWIFATAIATIVGVLLAPDALLSSDMMEPYMLLAFTAVVVGGLTSLPGVFVGGLIVGAVNNIATLYGSGDLAFLTVFVLLLAVLTFRPQGLFGVPEIERL